MPTISRKEFAELCGDDEKKLNVYISRDKVSTVPNNKKLIDTNNPVNSAFMNDRQMANQLKSAGMPVTKPSKIVTEKSHVKLPNKKKVELPDKPGGQKVPSGKTEREPKIVPGKIPAIPKSIQQQTMVQTARDMKRVDQEMEKKAQDIELQAIRIQTEKMRLEKTAGNLLPIDLVAGVIERHVNSILKTFEKGFERIADLYSNMAGMDAELRSDFLKECRVELGDCVMRAGEKAAEEIDILVGDYSENLMVGQRKA